MADKNNDLTKTVTASSHVLNLPQDANLQQGAEETSPPSHETQVAISADRVQASTTEYTHQGSGIEAPASTPARPRRKAVPGSIASRKGSTAHDSVCESLDQVTTVEKPVLQQAVSLATLHVDKTAGPRPRSRTMPTTSAAESRNTQAIANADDQLAPDDTRKNAEIQEDVFRVSHVADLASMPTCDESVAGHFVDDQIATHSRIMSQAPEVPAKASLASEMSTKTDNLAMTQTSIMQDHYGPNKFGHGSGADKSAASRVPRYQHTIDIDSLALDATPPPVPPKEAVGQLKPKRSLWSLKWGRKPKTWMDQMERFGVKDGLLVKDGSQSRPSVKY